MYHVSRRLYQCLLTFGLALPSVILLAQPRPLAQYSEQQQRQQTERLPLPSALCIDSQSVKLVPMISELRCNDAHKHVNGRKRTFIVDTQERLWVADMDVANQTHGTLAVPLIEGILWRVGERLERVFGDQAYNGVFAAKLARWSINFSKASSLESARGFVPIAKRWIVERSIAWTNFLRRVTKDYEQTVSSLVA